MMPPADDDDDDDDGVFQKEVLSVFHGGKDMFVDIDLGNSVRGRCLNYRTKKRTKKKKKKKHGSVATWDKILVRTQIFLHGLLSFQSFIFPLHSLLSLNCFNSFDCFLLYIYIYVYIYVCIYLGLVHEFLEFVWMN